MSASAAGDSFLPFATIPFSLSDVTREVIDVGGAGHGSHFYRVVVLP